MAFVQKIINDLTLVDGYLEKHLKLIEKHAPFFKTEGMKIEYLCRQLPYVIVELKQALAELKSINDTLEFRRESIEGELWKKYLESSKRHMAPKDITMYIKQDESFIIINEIVLEVSFVKNKITAMVEALDMLHWQLNSIVKLRVASIEEAVL